MTSRDDPDPYRDRLEAHLEPAHDDPNTPHRLEFTCGDVLTRSWQILRSNTFPIASTVWSGIVLTLIFEAIGAMLQPVDPNAEPHLGGLLITFLGLIFTTFISAGLAHYLLNVTSGRPYRFSDLFRCREILGRVILACLLFGAVILGTVMSAALVTGMLSTLIGPAALLIGIPAGASAYVFVFASLSQFLFLIVDRETSAYDSLSLSWRIMKGHILEYLMLAFLCGFMNLMGLLAFGVGVLITIPLNFVAMAVFYLAVSGQPVIDPLRMGRQTGEI